MIRNSDFSTNNNLFYTKKVIIMDTVLQIQFLLIVTKI